MKIYVQNLNDFTGGYIVGRFSPCLPVDTIKEVGFKKYKAGDSNPSHVHYKSIEYTIINKGIGVFIINNNDFIHVADGDIITIFPGTYASFKAITDCSVTILRTESNPDDKYLL